MTLRFRNEHSPRAVEAEYDRLAGIYDRQWRRYIGATLRLVDESLDCRAGEVLLDAPCGTGELERRLLERFPRLRIVGIDLSRNMLREAIEKNSRENSRSSPPGRLQWLRADVCEVPADDESFDWVVCANSFHYFRSPTTALAEFHRVLRPGGRLVLVDWCDDYLTCRLCSVWLRWTSAAFQQTYSLRHCRTLLEKAGLVVDDADRFRVGWLWGLMRLCCRRQD